MLGVSRTDADYLRAYLVELAREANILPWGVLSESFGSPDSAPPGVADIYTDLDTTRLEQVESEASLRQFLLHIDRTRRVPAQEMADRAERLLITGDPGSGKSTFIKHTAYLLASATQSGEPAALLAKLQPWSHGLLLPVYVELRAVAAYAAEHRHSQGSVRLFKQYLAHQLERWGVVSAWDALHRALENGETPALLLLDGLDEVSTNQRKLLVEMVNALAVDAAYSRHRMVVTCRPYAYYDMPADHRLRGFTEVTLAPFSPEQIDRFAANWYRRLSTGARPICSPDEAEARLKDLRLAVRRPDHRSLARRPILLTMMVQLHNFKGGRLPDDRVRLYKESVDLLLTRWNARSHDQPALRDFLELPDLKDEDVEKALYAIAFRGQAAEPDARDAGDGDEEPSADITEGDLRAWVRPYLGGSDPHAARFIQYIRERAGLLVRHKTDAYTFPHRSLQEFLAACHLARSDELDYKVDAAELVSNDASRWREVFVLAAGFMARYGKTSDAVAAINELCPDACQQQAVAAARWTYAQVAADALLEIGRKGVQSSATGRALWARVQQWLAALLAQQREPPAKSRVVAGVTLARLGDERDSVRDPLQMEFCCAPAGPFRMGEGKEQYEHDLDYTCWIARFPVTNAQFRHFVAAGGYVNADYWREAIAHKRWRDGQVYRYYAHYDENNQVKAKDGWFSAPHDYGEPFNLPNHPVVGVTWYEALAFTRWLEEQYARAGLLPAGLHVNLPNEPEWEKAARGGLRLPAAPLVTPIAEVSAAAPAALRQTNPQPGRDYPWGDGAEPERANYDETGIGATNAAGCFAFGASPYGVEELAGGVWEWTRSLWGKDFQNATFRFPYRAADGREQLAEGDRHLRILRGGAYYSDAGGVGCGLRNWSGPDDEYGIGGFRVVLSPFTSGL